MIHKWPKPWSQSKKIYAAHLMILDETAGMTEAERAAYRNFLKGCFLGNLHPFAQILGNSAANITND